jgi:hypothetical protein
MSLEYIEHELGFACSDRDTINDSVTIGTGWGDEGVLFELSREQAKAVYDHLGEQFGFHD